MKGAPVNHTLHSLLERGLELKATLAALSSYQTGVRNAVGGKGGSDDLPPPIELGPLQQLVKAECRALERVAARSNAVTVTTETENELPSISTSVPATSDAASNDADPLVIHILRSSNIRYLESVWAAACSVKRITGFHRRFVLTDSMGYTPKRTALVDIVADDGALWMKVSTITEKRILFELARAGWSTGSDADSSEDGDDSEDGAKVKAVVDGEESGGRTTQNEADAANGTELGYSNGKTTDMGRSGSQVEAEDSDDSGDDASEGRSLLKLARQLQAAANRAWTEFRHPRVVLVLPMIPADESISLPVADILRKVRAEGVEVRCGPLSPVFRTDEKTGPSSGETPDHNATHDTALFDRIVPSLRPPLTADINLDCTILLALISDVSHMNLGPDPELHPAISRQITRERDRHLLPIMLYPALVHRRLHTAAEAAARMREIVAAIGTPSETRRALLLLGEGAGRYDDGASIEREWAQTSVHATPPGLRFPVIVEPPEASPEADDASPDALRLPKHVSATLARLRLSDVNRGVWLLGWRHGWTTVTSNRVVARQVKVAAEQTLADKEQQQQQQQQQQEEEVEEGGENGRPWRAGPLVWALGTARSLLKKERGLRG